MSSLFRYSIRITPLTLLFGIAASLTAVAQQSVSIGTEQIKSNAVLWLNSPNKNQGVIIPIVTNKSSVTGESGMLVFDDSDDKIYYHNGLAWVEVGGSAATLPAGGDLSGTLTNASVIRLQGRSVSATVPTNGQVLKWNGTQWAPAADDAGSLPTLTANQIISHNGTASTAVTMGGDATFNGTTGALTIANNAITTAKILDGTIGNGDIAGTAAIAVTKLAAGTNGQILTTVAGAPAWATAPASVTTLDGLTDAQVTTPAGGQILVHDGTGNFVNRALSSDATLAATGALTIANNAVTTAKILDGTIGNGDISGTAAIAVTKLAAGTNGEVLTTAGGVPAWQAIPAVFTTQNTVPKGDVTGLVASNIYDDGNNVAIGTNAPYNKFTLSGAAGSPTGAHASFITTSDTHPVIQLMNWGHGDNAILFDSYLSTSNQWTSSSAGSNFKFHKYSNRFELEYASGVAAGSPISWATAMTVSTSGYVGFIASPATDATLTTQTSSGVHAIRMNQVASATNYWYEGSRSGDAYRYHGYNGVFKGSWSTVDGAYTSSSDRRLKKDIESLGTVLDKVLQLKPASYHMNEQASSDRKRTGLIAQDVLPLFPEFVDHDPMSDMYSLNYSGLSVVALKAIQEQQEQIDALKKEVEELKKLVQQLAQK